MVLILVFPSISSMESSSYPYENKKPRLDGYFIYNITKALSNIIFTAYSKDEIAKGRAFGTKGEHEAARIIAENLSKLGVYTTFELIGEKPRYPGDEIAHKLEVLEYSVRLNDEEVDCFPAPSWSLKGSLNKTFNYTGVKIKRIPRYPCLFDEEYASETEDFMFIDNDQWNDPNASVPVIDWLKPFMDPLKFYMLFHITSLLLIEKETAFWSTFYPKCRGLILYDFNRDCHDMIYFGGIYKNYLPVIFINGSIGRRIWSNPSGFKLDFLLKQRYNTSLVSYNVVGEINGSDPTRTIIVSSLYDCWWNQGTADSAIGVGIILAIAKYFKEHNITPRYNLKFIAFGGEEYGYRGAEYYEYTHRDEDIVYMVDLNQLGFKQEYPELTLDIVANKPGFLDFIGGIAKEVDFTGRTGVKVREVFWPENIPSNPLPFVRYRKSCSAVSFFKDGGWILHHRDGLNHSEGDVLKYYDWNEVNVTGELILNLVLTLATQEVESMNTGPRKAMYLESLSPSFAPFCWITI
ncbi:MAG TPA: M28 family peptidase [Thermoplasmatales archaeon]|nr:M28 family peptidase [Thermoplasmatales archaeon]